MTIGGLQKLTLIDYPGKIACTVFTIGCNFRCPFCHNPELVRSLKAATTSKKPVAAGFRPCQIIGEQEFFDFLKSRVGLLDGVCVTGGEPLLHHDLPEFLKKIKDLGFLVKLDTNGANPDKLKALVADKLIDYIAMDVKTSIGNRQYEKVCRVKVNLDDIKKSIQIIMGSGLDYEFRTTVVPGLHTEEDIIQIARAIQGAKRYYLQQFRPDVKLLEPVFQKAKPYPIEFFHQLKDKIKNFFEICEVRE